MCLQISLFCSTNSPKPQKYSIYNDKTEKQRQEYLVFGFLTFWLDKLPNYETYY